MGSPSRAGGSGRGVGRFLASPLPFPRPEALNAPFTHRGGGMAKKRVKLVEFDRNRLVADMALGRVIIEAESVRFHRNGKGRGVEVLGKTDRSDG